LRFSTLDTTGVFFELRRVSAIATMVDRILEAAAGEDPAAVARLVERLRALVPGDDRLVVALQGHPLGRDRAVAASWPEVDPLHGLRTYSDLELPDLIAELDEWSAFQQESMDLDADLFSQSPFDPTLRYWKHFLGDTLRAWVCGYDPTTTETLVLVHAGTLVLHMDPATHRWAGRAASLADILRLT
jgi:hypothetical protein